LVYIYKLAVEEVPLNVYIMTERKPISDFHSCKSVTRKYYPHED